MWRNYKRRHALSLVIFIVVFCASARSQEQVRVGYTIITADAGSNAPASAALFSYANNQGILVSEAAAAAAIPSRAFTIFVDESDTQTGIAVVNSSGRRASLALRLRNASGEEVMRRDISLEAARHLAAYVSELFTARPANFIGSLSVESDEPVAATTLRESRNRFGEPLYSTMPVVDTNAANNASNVFPHVVIGGGYTTEIILINGGASRVSGRVNLFMSHGTPMLARLNESTISDVAFQIEPFGTYRARLNEVSVFASGYAVIVPASGSAVPSGAAIFRYSSGGAAVTEAAVPAIPATTAARIFIDSAGTRTGFAITNPGSMSADLTMTLIGRTGTVQDTKGRVLPAGNHFAVFADELFSAVSGGFTGVLEIRSSVAVVPITLKLTANARADFVITTLPVADMNRPISAVSTVLPHIAIGSGFSTRLVLVNPGGQSSNAGTMTFYASDGSRLQLPFGGELGSQFPYSMSGASGRQFYPGDTVQVAGIFVRDPSSGLRVSEIVVNEGNTVQPIIDILDAKGAPRDDVRLTYSSLDPEISSVDQLRIRGRRRGFATLTMSAAGNVVPVTVTVVGVDSGVAGYDVNGIAQDLSRRLYLASSRDQTILQAQDLQQSPAVYAGIRQISGFRNGLRSESLFSNPAFLAFNQSDGSLYVSDTSNHAIRRIRPGTSGRVETVAGNGKAGSTDGRFTDATFNAPQGIALDDRGRLWIADSGNHTIRLIDLASGSIRTIAGTTGSPGFVDGTAQNARFSSPAGIAIIPVSAHEQLDRQRRGLAPAPIRAVIADHGNGVLREVNETGDVSTVSSPASTGLSNNTKARIGVAESTPSAITFKSPVGIAVDDSGNMYVSEPDSGALWNVLRNGSVVAAVQQNSLVRPHGLAITETGRIVVADSGRAPTGLRYGEPQITGVVSTTFSAKGGQDVTIQGQNFSQDSIVVIDGIIVSSAIVKDTRTIRFTTPPLSSSGTVTLSVQSRGGLAQTSLTIQALSLDDIPVGSITTIAGGSTYTGDGGLATSAVTDYVKAMAVDHRGNVFVSDNSGIRRISAASGIITTIAGRPTRGFSGDNGPAIAATLNNPNGLALDNAGNLLVADTDNSRIRKIDLTTGIISTIAGNGRFQFSGDNGPALQASFGNPQGIAVDVAGNLFITDTFNQRVRRIDARTQIITTIAGSGATGFGRGSFSGDGGLATDATLWNPTGVAVDSVGAIYINDNNNSRIRKIDPAGGIISTAAAYGSRTGAGTNGFVGVTVNSVDEIYFPVYGDNQVRKLNPATGAMNNVAGNGSFTSNTASARGDGGPATAATVSSPAATAIDAAGNLFIGEGSSSVVNNRIRKVLSPSGVITTFAGGTLFATLTGDGGPAIAARFRSPHGIAIDADGDIYLADTDDHRIRRIKPDLTIETVAGNGTKEVLPAGLPPVPYPQKMIADGLGNLYFTFAGVVDPSPLYRRHTIRKLATRTGVLTTAAGTTSAGFSGDNGPASLAQLNAPMDVAADAAGNAFIADYGNRRIRKIAASTGIITTVAGNGIDDYSGDNGLATQAGISPVGIALDSRGNLFIINRRFASFDPVFIEEPVTALRIRRIDAETGIITTIAGNGTIGRGGDGGPAVQASLLYPSDIAVDASGNIFIVDDNTTRIRVINATTGLISTVAGGGPPSPVAINGISALQTSINGGSLAFDRSGNLFFTDGITKGLRAIRQPPR